ncbi:MAG: amidohydrolase [Planctomycetes bacterium]|nr:amidohydrolase [Planctomycetota bacterium]
MNRKPSRRRRTIIDAHVHIPGSNGDVLGWPAPTALAETVAALDRAGIRQAVITSVRSTVAKDMQEIRAGNREMLAAVAAYPGRFIGACQVHPAFLAESLAELETMRREHGITWLGELCGYLGNYQYDTPEFAQVIAKAAELNMIVQIHTTDIPGLRKLADAHPQTPFILAHMGGRDDHKARVQAVKECPNLYVDISGSDISRVGILEAYIREAGPDKVLFATDWIVCDPGIYVHRVNWLDIPEADKEKIFHGNVERLLTRS